MKYYRELTLLPDAEVSLNFLWSKVFMQIHIAIAEAKKTDTSADFGISFPEYSEEALGTKLRIFALDQEHLNIIKLDSYLARLREYVHLTSIRKVPSRITGYACYSRYQPDASIHSKAVRYVKRHKGVTYEAALALLRSKKPAKYLPYIQFHSISNMHRFSLYIRKTVAEHEVYSGFSYYGLSSSSTVPEF